MKLPEAETVGALQREVLLEWSSKASGPELERLARTTGALRRRRGVKSASGLLRVALSYGFCGLSLEQAAEWARCNGAAKLSPVALFNRLRNCGAWLEALVAAKLGARAPQVKVAGLRVRLVDATRIRSPGRSSKGWRVHASYDPWSGQFDGLEITDGKGGERLSRFDSQAGDLFVGDRGYAHRRGLAHVRRTGGHFVVRINWANVPLLSPDGKPFDLLKSLKSLPKDGTPAEYQVLTKPDELHGLPALPCRLVAVRKTPEAALEARKKSKSEAKKKHRQVDARTLKACAYFFVLTSVDASVLSAKKVLELYRARWQIEVAFKRLKTFNGLRSVPAKDENLARTVLAAKMLAVLILEDRLVAKGYCTTHIAALQYEREELRRELLGHNVPQRAHKPTWTRTSRIPQVQRAASALGLHL